MKRCFYRKHVFTTCQFVKKNRCPTQLHITKQNASERSSISHKNVKSSFLLSCAMGKETACTLHFNILSCSFLLLFWSFKPVCQCRYTHSFTLCYTCAVISLFPSVKDYRQTFHFLDYDTSGSYLSLCVCRCLHILFCSASILKLLPLELVTKLCVSRIWQGAFIGGF